MLAIRLARRGKNKQPTFRLIVLEKSKDNFGPYLENLGYYNPKTKVTEVKKDRILYWLSKGAKPTPTVHNLLVDQNVITGPKVKASKGGKKTEEKKEAPMPALQDRGPDSNVGKKPATVETKTPEMKTESKQ